MEMDITSLVLSLFDDWKLDYSEFYVAVQFSH